MLFKLTDQSFNLIYQLYSQSILFSNSYSQYLIIPFLDFSDNLFKDLSSYCFSWYFLFLFHSTFIMPSHSYAGSYYYL